MKKDGKKNQTDTLAHIFSHYIEANCPVSAQSSAVQAPAKHGLHWCQPLQRCYAWWLSGGQWLCKQLHHILPPSRAQSANTDPLGLGKGLSRAITQARIHPGARGQIYFEEPAGLLVLPIGCSVAPAGSCISAGAGGGVGKDWAASEAHIYLIAFCIQVLRETLNYFGMLAILNHSNLDSKHLEQSDKGRRRKVAPESFMSLQLIVVCKV